MSPKRASRSASRRTPHRRRRVAATRSSGSSLADAIKEQPKLPLWLTHLWQRASEHRRLGLVLGAGVSFDAKVPLWGELVSRLAQAAGISEQLSAQHQKERFPETFLAEILYRHHHADHPKSADNPSTATTSIASTRLGNRRFGNVCIEMSAT